MNTVAIVQARAGSSRLPGKVLSEICGVPMLELVVSRVAQIEGVDRAVVATTALPADDRIESLALKLGCDCFRGDEHDVLKRFRDAAEEFRADVVLRVTADCPLLDPAVGSLVLQRFRKGGFDYTSNIKPPTYPDGLDVEVFSTEALERAHREATLQSHREHVTPYIWKNPGLFRLGNVENDRDLSHLRWTVDGPEDLEMFEELCRHLPSPITDARMDEVISVLEAHSEISAINAMLARNASMERQFAEEQRSSGG